MSIEQLIHEHTLAVQKNTEELSAFRIAVEALLDRLNGSEIPTPAIVAPAVPTAEVEQFPEQEVPTIAAEDLPSTGAAVDVVSKAEEDETPPFDDRATQIEVTYEMLKEAAVKASTRFGRDFIIKNLAAYGASRLPEVDKQYYHDLYLAFTEGEA